MEKLILVVFVCAELYILDTHYQDKDRNGHFWEQIRLRGAGEMSFTAGTLMLPYSHVTAVRFHLYKV